MLLQTLILAIVVIGFGCAQYLLALHAIRDLIRRPRVRGGNKVSWGLAILCLPIAGALIYSWMGPASFIRRAPFAATTATVASAPNTTAATQPGGPRAIPEALGNVTPIRGRRVPTPGVHPDAPAPNAPARVRHTGS